jgi:hypothetical protein
MANISFKCWVQILSDFTSVMDIYVRELALY